MKVLGRDNLLHIFKDHQTINLFFSLLENIIVYSTIYMCYTRLIYAAKHGKIRPSVNIWLQLLSCLSVTIGPFFASHSSQNLNPITQIGNQNLELHQHSQSTNIKIVCSKFAMLMTSIVKNGFY